MTSEQLFQIYPYAGDFHTGRLRDGRQVLLGLLCPELVAYFFDERGHMLTGARRAWRTPATRIGGHGPYNIDDPTFCAAIQQQISEWKLELELEEGPIRIAEFFDADLAVGIEVVPGQFDDGQDEETPSERVERVAAKSKWVRSGKFVFWWAKDYWMSREGKVEST